MSISSSDILMHFSVTSGSSGYSTSGTANGSLGKYISTTIWNGNTINDLFPDLTVEDNINEVVDYRCVFLFNNHTSLPLKNTVLWISYEVSGGANMAIGLDPVGSTLKNSVISQASTIPNANTVPSGVVFSTPLSKGTGLTIGDLNAGSVYGIWIRRTAQNTVFLLNDGATLKVEGDAY
jgi:hypothetical protein